MEYILNIINWLVENKELSMGGLAILLAFSFYFVFNKRVQSQKSGNNSTNIQVGGSLNIGRTDKDD